MADLTAGEVHALAALADHHPLTVDELARSVADAGMHLGSDDVATILQRLVDTGMTERTPAAILGKYRATPEGRDWIRSRNV
jgi:predicted transcriptional regulator